MKSSESYLSAKQVSVTAESIWAKPLTKPHEKALDRVAMRQTDADVAPIDYSAIPALTDKQLAQFRHQPE